MPRISRNLAMLMIGVFSLPLQAGQPLTYNRVDFHVAVEQQTSNDEITVTMAVELDDDDPVRLAGKINKRMQAALAQTAVVPQVRSRSGNYSVRPVHNREQRLDHWRGSQTLILNSRDLQAMTALIQALQEHMLVKSTRFSVSSDKREQLQQDMTTRALAKFRQRAELITRGLGFSRYRIVNVNVHSSGGAPPPVYALAMADSAVKSMSSPPALESGWSDINLQVSGTIEMELND